MKATFYIDDETLAKFKSRSARRSGTLRQLSAELQLLIQDSLVEENLSAAFRELGAEPGTMSSSWEVRPVVPRVKTSSSQAVRELRESRHAPRLPRH